MARTPVALLGYIIIPRRRGKVKRRSSHGQREGRSLPALHVPRRDRRHSPGGLHDCSGLEEETEDREYREGGDQTSVRKLAGLNSYAPIVLEMGSAADSELWEWRQRVKREGAQGNRKAITIIQQNEAREEVKR